MCKAPVGPSVALVREAQINAGHSPTDGGQLFLNLITMLGGRRPAHART